MEKHSGEKKNCWEFHKCGRELGGENAYKDGVCPASVEVRLDGMHGGHNAGRCCWAVVGTMCKGNVAGTLAQKLKDCSQCSFYMSVREEEGDNLLPTYIILEKLDQELE